MLINIILDSTIVCPLKGKTKKLIENLYIY